MRFKFIIFFSLLLFCACSKADVIEIVFKNTNGTASPTLEVELARTNSTRQMGLMYRKKMDLNRGMIFIFPDQDERTFWMRNTYLPLDMIFVSSEKKVVGVVENATPLTDTPRNSNGPAKYVVEVNSGLAKTWGVIKGTTLEGQIPGSLD